MLLRTAALSLGAELIDSLTASSSACLSEGSRLRSFASSAGKDSEWLLSLIPDPRSRPLSPAKSSSNLELARGGKLFVTPLPQFKISVCQFTPPVLPPRRTVSMGGSLSMAEAGRLAAPPC